MAFVTSQKCTGCGSEYPANQLMNLCPIDGRPVELVIDTTSLQSNYPNLEWYQPNIKSMWRFGGLLGLDNQNAIDGKNIVSLGEGFTPLIPLQEHPVANKFNFNLALKDEGQPHPGFGRNPTASFKDRGMSMAISMAKKFGIKKVVVPTQGNAGDSMVEYALAAGMECVAIMPENTPMPILGRVSALAKMHNEVKLELVKGTIREAGALMKQKYLPQGYFNMATFQEPGWRIEGKKTLGLEIAEPSKRDGKWQLPDVILYPTGGGTGILGMWKAFSELESLGLINEKRPKIICVQSSATAPVVRAFETAQADSQVVEPGETIATGLNVPGGVGHFKVLEIIRQSGGAAFTVSENEISQNLKFIYSNYNIWICPEGAATIAALTPSINAGLINEGDDVVCFNTGSFEKYLSDLKSIVFS